MRRLPVQRLLRLLIAAGALAGVLAALAPQARAEHTEDQRITDDTADTLRDGDVRLGLFKAEVGVLDDLTLTSHTLPWFILAANLGAKYRLYQQDPWSISARLSVFHLDLQRLIGDEGTPEASISIVPVEFFSSYRLSSWPMSLHAGITFSGVKVNGSLDEQDVKGAAAQSNVMLSGSLEYRWTARSALVFFTRAIVLQELSGGTTSTFNPDDFTTVELVGGVGVDGNGAGLGNAFQVGGAWVYSSDSFNLRLGGGFGDVIAPVVNIGFPTRGRTFIPEIDLYWIF